MLHVILVIILCAALLFLKPVRRLTAYCAKNIVFAIFLLPLSFLCSIFGFALPLNIFSLGAALLLGLPGISLALFLPLII